jgi:hypothetical protein
MNSKQTRKLNKKLNLILDKENKIMATIQELQAAVTRNTDTEDSVIVLLNGLSQQLKDAQASGDPAAIADVVSKIDANTAKLAEAVVANTPATPTPPVTVQ